ncbi:MAG: hypothetical protein WAZ94_01980 [Phycisphaerales bacterium]
MHRTTLSVLALSTCLAPCAFAQELWRQNPVNSFGGPSAQDARNPGGLGWFSEVVDNFQGQAGSAIGSIEFWGGYAQDLPGNTHGFMIRFYDGADGQVGTLLSTQDVFTFSETEYYNTTIPPIGILRGYHYTLDLGTPVTIPADGQYWISITAILDRGGTANEPQWGWIASSAFNAPGCMQRFFSPTFTPQSQDVAFVLHAADSGPSCDPDVNQDGNADQDDFAYLTNVIGGGENPTGIDPDFNQDGNADQDDLASLVNVLAGGPCP